MSPKRPPTAADERDLYPRKTPPKGHPADFSAIPHEVIERGTGVVEGDELRAVRENRPPADRLARLEAFKDDMLARVPRIETNVEWLVARKKEEIEERRLAAELASRAQANQVGLETVRLNSRAKIILGIFGIITTALGVAATLLAKAVS